MQAEAETPEAAPRRLPGWRQVAAALFVALAFGFLGAAVYRNLDDLRAFQWEVRPLVMAASVLLLIGAFLWGVRVWQLVLRRFGHRIGFRPLARIWFLSNAGRYIPGKVWQFVGVAHLGSNAGLPAVTAVGSLMVQMGITLISAVLLGTYLLPASTGVLGPALPWLRWLAPLALVAVHPLVIDAAIRMMSRVTRRPVAAWNSSWADGLWLLLLSTVAWVFFGLAFYLFLLSLTPAPVSVIPALIAMNAIAFIAGYVVFIAPAGLGAKEGALAALLATLVPLPVAAAVAVAARLWTVVGEVIPAVWLLRTGGEEGR